MTVSTGAMTQVLGQPPLCLSVVLRTPGLKLAEAPRQAWTSLSGSF